MTPTAVKSNGKVETLQEKHARLVKEWSVRVGAERARVGAAIGQTELELEIEGLEYEPFVRPTAWAQKWDRTPEQLIERLAKVRALAADESKRDVIRANAQKEVDKLTTQAERRGIEVPS